MVRVCDWEEDGFVSVIGQRMVRLDDRGKDGFVFGDWLSMRQ